MPLPRMRARDWLRRFSLEWRDALLLENDNEGVREYALIDGYALTCLKGDVNRERDSAVLRNAPDVGIDTT